MAPDPKENGGAVGERMDHDAVPPTGKKDAAKGNVNKKKDEKNKDDDLVSLFLPIGARAIPVLCSRWHTVSVFMIFPAVRAVSWELIRAEP